MSDLIGRRDWLPNAGLVLMATHFTGTAGSSLGLANEKRATLNPLRLEDSDLRSYMRLGTQHIYRSAIDRSRGCLPYVCFNLTEKPT